MSRGIANFGRTRTSQPATVITPTRESVTTRQRVGGSATRTSARLDRVSALATSAGRSSICSDQAERSSRIGFEAPTERGELEALEVLGGPVVALVQQRHDRVGPD